MLSARKLFARGLLDHPFSRSAWDRRDTDDELFPYQRDGVDFLASRRVGLLFDGMGLGKSAQAIRAADQIGARQLLIVCPAIARTNWERELAKFGLLPRRVQVVTSATEAIDANADV